MQSKTSFFNRTLFWSLFRRYWPIFAAYFVIWLVVLPATLAGFFSYALRPNSNFDPVNFFAQTGNIILNSGFFGGIILSAITGIVLAMAAYNYLYNAKSVSLFCALPIRREGVFLSHYIAGMAGMLVINLLIFLIALAISAAYGQLSLSLSFLLQWLAMVCLMSTFYFGFASLCASFTGNVLVLPVVFGLLNFTVYVVGELVQQVMRLFVYGLVPSGPIALSFLSPPVYMVEKLSVKSLGEVNSEGVWVRTGTVFEGWLPLIIFALVGLVFVLLAVLLIRRRRMETAGDVVALKPLKPIFKYCMAFGCALVIGIIIFYTAFHGTESRFFLGLMLLSMLFGGFVGYFASEMLLQKTLRVFGGRTWFGMVAVALVITGFLLATEYDAFGLERKIPAPEEIENIRVSVSGESAIFEQEDNIRTAITLHGDIIRNKDANEALENTSDYSNSSSYVMLDYIYKDGRSLSRSYNIYWDSGTDIQTLSDLLNTKEAVDWRKRLTFPVTPESISDAYVNYFDMEADTYQTLALTGEQAYALYHECILPDIEDGALGKIWLVTDEDYYQTVYECTINFSVLHRNSDGEYEYESFYTTLTVNAERTKRWITENLGIEPVTYKESGRYETGVYPYPAYEKALYQ